MSEFESSSTGREARGAAGLPSPEGSSAGKGALPFHAALEQAADDIARGMFRPVVISAVSLLALGFAAMKVALYFTA